MATPEVNQMLAAAAAACEDKKAEDIRILALDPSESALSDYFLICSGNSDRQNVAITDEVEGRLKRDFGVYPNSVEGRRLGEWILMDYVDFIVHVFSTEKRAFYGLERLRKSATTLTQSDLNALIEGQNSRKKSPRSKLKEAVAASETQQPKPAKRAAKKAHKVTPKTESKKMPKKSSTKKTAKKTSRKPAN